MAKSTGCRANHDMMMGLLDKITKTINGASKLEAFLKKSAPHVLDMEAVQSKDVFPDYDPELITIPRRHIIKGVQADQLQVAIAEFIKSKNATVSNYIIVNGVAYIEYLPKFMAGLLPAIPTANWLTKRY